MRLLILGATGMLGYQLFKTCIDRNRDVHAVVRNKRLLIDRHGPEVNDRISLIDDVKNINSIEDIIIAIKPDYVINCAGIIKQSPLAENHYESIAINSFLPHQLERLGSMHNYRLIHISTDCVFDGKKGGYKEDDLANAYDLYGRTKYLGEVSYGCGITLRTSIIGHVIGETNYGLIDWFLAQSNKINGYTKAIFSGLTTLELTRVILDIIIPQNVKSGLYQVSSTPISKYNLLQVVGDVYKKGITIIPSDEVIIDRSLDSSRFNSLTSYNAPSWPVMVKEMYEDFIENFH